MPVAERITARFVAAANQIIARVVELSNALFSLPAAPLASAEGLSQESRLYYLVGDAALLLTELSAVEARIEAVRTGALHRFEEAV